MAYIVIKTIKGRRYRYEQRSYREGGRVRTESRYLGPADGAGRAPSMAPRGRRGILRKLGELIAANTLSPDERARVVDEDALLREAKAREAAREKARADFEARTGMRLGPRDPVPINKPPSSIDYDRLATTQPATVTPVPTAGGPDIESLGEDPTDNAGPDGSE